MRPAFILSLLLVSGMAAAAPQKPPAKAVDTRPRIEKLFDQLAKAGSADEARPIEAKIEAEFRISGSPSVDLLMTRVHAATAADDTKTARKLAQAVTAIAPGYAEGWHVRAGLESAADDDTAALISLQKVVLLNPRNFTALTELGSMLESYGDKAGALKLYRRALALDPQLEGAARHVKALTTTVEGRDI